MRKYASLISVLLSLSCSGRVLASEVTRLTTEEALALHEGALARYKEGRPVSKEYPFFHLLSIPVEITMTEAARLAMKTHYAASIYIEATYLMADGTEKNKTISILNRWAFGEMISHNLDRLRIAGADYDPLDNAYDNTSRESDARYVSFDISSSRLSLANARLVSIGGTFMATDDSSPAPDLRKTFTPAEYRPSIETIVFHMDHNTKDGWILSTELK